MTVTDPRTLTFTAPEAALAISDDPPLNCVDSFTGREYVLTIPRLFRIMLPMS